MTVSGDGLIHEVVNGLCTRDDWKQFKETITIGCIPGGTANGLVKSLLDHTGEKFSVLDATFKVAKGVRRHMDITELTMEYEKNKVYSFLAVAWSIIADCDINSEAIRCIGSARFTIWGVWRTLFKRHYQGSLRFRGKHIRNRNEVDTNEEAKGQAMIDSTNEPLITEKTEVNNQDFMYFVAQNTPWLGDKFHTHPLSKINDGQNDIVYLTFANGGTCRLARTLIDQDNGEWFLEDGTVRNNDLGIEYVKCNNWELYPTVKGPAPADDSVRFEDSRHESKSSAGGLDEPEVPIQHQENAIFSIDGEKYKSQSCKARSLKQYFPIYY